MTGAPGRPARRDFVRVTVVLDDTARWEADMGRKHRMETVKLMIVCVEKQENVPADCQSQQQFKKVVPTRSA